MCMRLLIALLCLGSVLVSCFGNAEQSHLQERLLTWDIPGFTAFNNQIVIHVELMIWRDRMGQRRLVSPGFYFLSDDLLIPFDKLFNMTLVGTAVLPASSAPDRNTAAKVGTIEELFASREQYVRVVDQPDPPSIVLLWEFVYWKWIVALTGSPSSLWRVLDQLQFREDIFVTQEAHRIAKKFRFEEEVLGVHLRGVEWEYNCNNKFRYWDPRVRIYSCYQGRCDQKRDILLC